MNTRDLEKSSGPTREPSCNCVAFHSLITAWNPSVRGLHHTPVLLQCVIVLTVKKCLCYIKMKLLLCNLYLLTSSPCDAFVKRLPSSLNLPFKYSNSLMSLPLSLLFFRLKRTVSFHLPSQGRFSRALNISVAFLCTLSSLFMSFWIVGTRTGHRKRYPSTGSSLTTVLVFVVIPLWHYHPCTAAQTQELQMKMRIWKKVHLKEFWQFTESGKYSVHNPSESLGER